ncbi:MAG: hypothetical protein AAGA77_09870 [Bacteroidota bacterium]
MISEKKFIAQYKNFWNEIFPGLNNYIRKINRRNVSNDENGDKSVLEEEGELSIQINTDLIGFVNDIAFAFFDSEINGKKLRITKKSVIQEYEKIKRLHKYRYFRNPDKDGSSIADEIQLIRKIKERLIKKYAEHQPFVAPNFYGCGFQNEVFGDIIYKETLVEVKARGNKSEKGISAGFLSRDIIQLFIYAALYFSEQREERIEPRFGQLLNFELYNPRIGCTWHENIDIVAENISGGSSTDIFDEIIRFLSYTTTSL